VDYVIRAENAATALRTSEEVISDPLLIAMVLKGLPSSFKTFSAIIVQRDKREMTFAEFKTALRSYEESERSRSIVTLGRMLCYLNTTESSKAPVSNVAKRVIRNLIVGRIRGRLESGATFVKVKRMKRRNVERTPEVEVSEESRRTRKRFQRTLVYIHTK
jgi:hypothetical protein